jgi:hypothetical protein
MTHDKPLDWAMQNNMSVLINVRTGVISFSGPDDVVWKLVLTEDQARVAMANISRNLSNGGS